MAKKAKAEAKAAKKKGFTVSEIISNIANRNLEVLKEEVEARVEVMVTSLANRKANLENYEGRVDRMISGLQDAGNNVVKIRQWLEKKF